METTKNAISIDSVADVHLNNIQDRSLKTNFGFHQKALGHQEAVMKLRKEINEIYVQFKPKKKYGSKGILFASFFGLCWLTVISFVGTVLKWVYEPEENYVIASRVIVETLIFLLCTVCFAFFQLSENWKFERGVMRQLKKKTDILLEKYEDLNYNKINDDLANIDALNIDSMHLVSTLRGKRWIKIPFALLIHGDIVYSLKPEIDFENYDIDYQHLEGNYFLIKQSILPQMLKNRLEQKPKSRPFQIRVSKLAVPFSIFCVLTYIIAMIINVVRLSTGWSAYNWVDLMFFYPLYTVVFLLPIGFPFVWSIIHLISKARLLSLFDYLTKRKNIDITSQTRNQTIDAPLFTFFFYLLEMLRGIFHPLESTIDPFHLARVNSICCNNADGILKNYRFNVEELLFISEDTFNDKSESHDVAVDVKVGHDVAVDVKVEEPPQFQENKDLIPENMEEAANIEEIQENTESEIPMSSKTENLPVSIEVDRQDEVELEDITVAEQSQADVSKDDTKQSKEKELNFVTMKLYDNRGSLIFENQEWERYAQHMKPMGLAFLVIKHLLHSDQDVKPFDKMTTLQWIESLTQVSYILGFNTDLLESMNPQFKITTFRKEKFICGRVVDFEGAGMQIYTYGDPEMLLDYCYDYWDGQDIRPLTPDVKNGILKMYNEQKETQDVEVVAFSYKPLDPNWTKVLLNNEKTSIQLEEYENLNELDSDTLSLFYMQQSQFFLGLVVLRKMTKQYLPPILEELSDNAGIRFCYFSPHNIRVTKNIGYKLGLEWEWNSCISLGDPRKPIILDQNSKFAHLPVGIKQIKTHLETTDDVPLLVGLFSDATPKSTGEMIDIFKENEQTVCFVGASTDLSNLSVYSQADVAISVEPDEVPQILPDFDVTDHTIFQTFRELTSIGCIRLKQSANKQIFGMIYHLVKACRREVTNIEQSFTFFLGANLGLFLLQLFSLIFVLPPIFNGLQAIWIMCVIIPILSVLLTFNPMDPKVMEYITIYRKTTIKSSWKLLFRTISYFWIPIPLSMVVFVWVLLSLENVNLSFTDIWFGKIPINTYNSKSFHASLVYAQNFCQLYFVLHLCFIFFGFIHPRESIFKIFPHCLVLFSIPAILLLQIIFCVVSCSIVHSNFEKTEYYPVKLPFYSYIILLILTPINIVLFELRKVRKRKRYNEKQKREKLIFGTRLGMWSPH